MKQRTSMMAGLLAALVLAGCGSGPKASNTQPQTSLGDPVQVRIGQTATVASDKVSVTFTGISEDSRCPTGAQCAWAGQAIVSLKVSPTGGGPGEAQLILGGGQPGSDEFSFGLYMVKITSLDPLPVADVKTNPDDYVATLVISKK